MFLKINKTLIPLDQALINLEYAHVENKTPGVLITLPGGAKFRLTDEVAQTARALFAGMEEKGKVVDLNKVFKQSLPPPPPSSGGRSSSRPCPLAHLHAEMQIPCPSCGTRPGPQTAPESIPTPTLVFADAEPLPDPLRV